MRTKHANQLFLERNRNDHQLKTLAWLPFYASVMCELSSARWTTTARRMWHEKKNKSKNCWNSDEIFSLKCILKSDFNLPEHIDIIPAFRLLHLGPRTEEQNHSIYKIWWWKYLWVQTQVHEMDICGCMKTNCHGSTRMALNCLYFKLCSAWNE